MIHLKLAFEDYAICGICKKQFIYVSKKHIELHGLSVIEYEEKFGENNRVSFKNSRMRRNLLNAGNKNSMTLERVEKQRLGIIPYGGACTQGFKIFRKKRKSRNTKILLEENKEINIFPLVIKDKLYSHSETYKKELSERMKLHNPMKNEETWKKNILKHSRKKSSIEIWFENFCELYNFPFDYCGNNKIWINGKNPDFIYNKKVIEISSDYKGRNESYDYFRIEHFRKSGFDCMVITLWYIPSNIKESIEKFLYEELNLFLNRNSYEDIKIITVPDLNEKIRIRVAL